MHMGRSSRPAQFVCRLGRRRIGEPRLEPLPLRVHALQQGRQGGLRGVRAPPQAPLRLRRLRVQLRLGAGERLERLRVAAARKGPQERVAARAVAGLDVVWDDTAAVISLFLDRMGSVVGRPVRLVAAWLVSSGTASCREQCQACACVQAGM